MVKGRSVNATVRCVSIVRSVMRLHSAGPELSMGCVFFYNNKENKQTNKQGRKNKPN